MLNFFEIEGDSVESLSFLFKRDMVSFKSFLPRCMFLHVLSLMIFVLGIQSLYGQDMSYADSLRQVWQYNTEKGRYADVVGSATRVYSDTDDTLSELSMYAAVMTGQAYGMLGIKDSMDLWLSRAFRAASLREDAWVLGAVYSSLASYTMDHEGNFYKCISYFIKGLEVTEGKSPVYYTLEGNLALVYYLRNDYSGLKYAEDVLDYGLKTSESSYIFVGALTSAYFLHAMGRDDEALKVISPIVDSIDNFYNHAGIYTLYADILHNTGTDVREVEKYYQLALEYTDSTDEKSCSDAYYNYGKWLVGQGRPSEAFGLVSEGAERVSQPLYRYRLYEVLSDACRSVGDYSGALDWFEKYHACSDSIFIRDREQSVNELFVRYDTERYRREAYENEIRLLNVSKRMYLYASVCILALASLAGFMVFHIKKNRKYKLIAQKYMASVKNEELSEKAALVGSDETKTVSDDERMHNLFLKVEELMKTGMAYRDKSISVVSVAAGLESNRTYLSNCINRFSGMSFTSYVNSFRIQEAVKILSDAGCDMPLKELSDRLGFNDISTFYRSFRSIVGMPPSRYRQEVRRLSGSF